MLHQYDIVFRTVLTRSCVRFECRPPACRQTPVFRHHSETTDRSRFAALNPLQCEHTALGSIRQRPIGVDLIQMAAGDTTACSTPYRERRLSVNAIAEKLHISKSTLYHYLRHRGVEIGS